MPNLKDIKTRIVSVKKTRQITSAMKLVAAAKLKGATERATAAQPYQQKLKQVLGRLGERVDGDAAELNPLLSQRDEVKKVLLVLLTSDRGLCGGFNNNLMRRAQPWIADRIEGEVSVEVRVFGRKGRDFCKSRGIDFTDSVLDYAKTPKMDLVRPLSNVMVEGYASGEFDEVWLGYNIFENAASQVPTFSKVLPLSVDADEADDTSGNMVDYIYEPSPQALLESLIPLYLRTLVLQAFLETEAGEFGARMLAMDNATRNAGDLIDRLSLEYNRARQAAITTEITEIVSGAEAL